MNNKHILTSQVSLYQVKNETFVGTAHARPQSGKRISPSTFARSFALSFSAAQRFVHFTQASHTHATCRTRAERSALPPRLIPGYTKEGEGKSLWPSPKNHKFRGEKRWWHRPTERGASHSFPSLVSALSFSFCGEQWSKPPSAVI